MICLYKYLILLFFIFILVCLMFNLYEGFEGWVPWTWNIPTRDICPYSNYYDFREIEPIVVVPQLYPPEYYKSNKLQKKFKKAKKYPYHPYFYETSFAGDYQPYIYSDYPDLIVPYRCPY